MKRVTFTLALLFVVGAIFNAIAQQATPSTIVVQPANAPAATTLPAQTASTATPGFLQDVIKSLEKAKALNAETIKKQQDQLSRLEELQQAAQQLKIFTHRS